MHDHFDKLSGVLDAVVQGDLESSRTRASSLQGAVASETYSPRYRDFASDVMQAAQLASEAESIESAAERVANIALACGRCHASQGFNATKSDSSFPSEQPAELSEKMWQHLWAADQLWLGVVGPSNTAWKAGSSALLAAELTSRDIADATEAMRILAAKVIQFAKSAEEASDHESRARVLGQFLGTCAGCHRER
jgi:cytochrome c553